MRPYLAILGARFRMLLQYRAAAIAGVVTQIMFGLVLLMVYEAFYAASAAPKPLSLDRLATYVWLAQSLFRMLPWSLDPEIRAMVRSGAVAYELCRPVDLYALWFARAVAQCTAPALLRMLPMLIFAMLVLPAIGLAEWRLAPPSAAAGLGFVPALALAIVLASALTTLLAISLIWTVSGDGTVMLATIAMSIGSGMLVPLPLLPDGVRVVLEWLPFAGLVDLPFRIYLGEIAGGEVAGVLARQLAWAIVLVAFGRWLVARAARRLVVQGG